MKRSERDKGLLNEDGASMVEYALLLAFIALIVFSALVVFGETVYELYQQFLGLFPD